MIQTIFVYFEKGNKREKKPFAGTSLLEGEYTPTHLERCDCCSKQNISLPQI